MAQVSRSPAATWTTFVKGAMTTSDPISPALRYRLLGALAHRDPE